MLISRFLTVGESIVAMFYEIGIKHQQTKHKKERSEVSLMDLFLVQGKRVEKKMLIGFDQN